MTPQEQIIASYIHFSVIYQICSTLEAKFRHDTVQFTKFYIQPTIQLLFFDKTENRTEKGNRAFKFLLCELVLFQPKLISLSFS